MDELKKEALAKWKRIIKGGSDFGPSDCSYCKKYRKPLLNIVSNMCEGCPIYLKTGFNGCVGTPYGSWENLCRSLPGNYIPQSIKILLTPNKLYNKEIDRKLYLRGVKIAAKMYAFIYNLPE